MFVPSGNPVDDKPVLEGSSDLAVDKLPKVTPGDEVLVYHTGCRQECLMPGWTSYSALFRIGNVTCPGQTVFITGAAGVCGSMLGQMAKILGCRVIGTAGSASKVGHLKSALGFDEALNYRRLSTVEA
eukprot:CAMPEP_0179171974 /NCGR_PEP_ID=MMETSP0796-20121207/84796_1 /TAXON_ID=73915 /ORGANISM="Pyrodinium bahamense, Strain pbaha01" /LENGTH=127 /DNA_ID=CAMNT_0020875081 /DNA_START=284 /DNA_END=666 /DNA_ORIENTATION=+